MLHKLEAGVYCSSDSDYDRPILGLVSGDKYSLIIDAGESPEHARKFQKEISELDIAPLRYLVLTHHHPDHTSGLIEWKQVISISSKTTREKVWDIDVIFQDELLVDLGGITCTIKEIPSSHTADSTIVYVPERKVLFLGDSLYTTRVDRKFRYWRETTLRMIETLEHYNADYYVFSHLPLCACDKDGMDKFLSKLKLIAECSQMGRTADEVTKALVDTYGCQPTNDESFLINCFF